MPNKEILTEISERTGVPFETIDGWLCRGSSDYLTSLRNFPVQGSGASLMRQALTACVKDGLQMMCPHHDALYVIHLETDTGPVERVTYHMDEAVKHFFGDELRIRHDIKTHYPNDDWVEEKGRAMYDQLRPFLLTDHPDIQLRTPMRPVIQSENLFEELFAS